ncbi:MAG: class I SAM-dependent methyltransferase, partial [Chloroflexi bacterium]|nr:class I SAM-dependent methyltransferase [Chloroflexota bacterium]
MPLDRPPVCDYEGSTYQQTFWEGGGRAYEDRAEAIALRRLLPAAGKLLLEIGAGAGRNTPRYAGYQRVVLLDYSRSQLRQAQERLGRAPRYLYVAADAYRLPFVDGLFDGATMIRVIHHMADAPAALRESRRVLQPGAAFVLEFASKRNLKAIARWLLRRQDWSPFDRRPVEFATLNFDFHPGAMRAWLAEGGFEVQRQLAVSYFRLGVLKRAFPAGLLVWLDSWAQLTGAWGQFSPSVFVGARANASGPTAPPGAFFHCPECGCARLNDRGDHLQ